MTEDRDKWRKYMEWPSLRSRTAKEQNRVFTGKAFSRQTCTRVYETFSTETRSGQYSF